jgi:pyruvyltransferase
MFYVKRAFIPNLGDSMNVQMAEHLLGKGNFTCLHQHEQSPTGTEYLMIGSILQWANSSTVVWGSGFISQNSRVKAPPKKILAVRGPLTRQILMEQQNINCPEVYGDAALLYPKFFKPKVQKQYELGIIPHYIDKKIPLTNKFKNIPGISIINIQGPVNDVITEICKCKRIASSCLHGIILSDAYGVPSTWLEYSDKVIGKGFKFRDYYMSVGRIPEEPLQMTDAVTINNIMDRFIPYNLNIDLDKLYSVCPLRNKK